MKVIRKIDKEHHQNQIKNQNKKPNANKGDTIWRNRINTVKKATGHTPPLPGHTGNCRYVLPRIFWSSGRLTGGCRKLSRILWVPPYRLMRYTSAILIQSRSWRFGMNHMGGSYGLERRLICDCWFRNWEILQGKRRSMRHRPGIDSLSSSSPLFLQL